MPYNIIRMIYANNINNDTIGGVFFKSLHEEIIILINYRVFIDNNIIINI